MQRLFIYLSLLLLITRISLGLFCAACPDKPPERTVNISWDDKQLKAAGMQRAKREPSRRTFVDSSIISISFCCIRTHAFIILPSGHLFSFLFNKDGLLIILKQLPLWELSCIKVDWYHVLRADNIIKVYYIHMYNTYVRDIFISCCFHCFV